MALCMQPPGSRGSAKELFLILFFFCRFWKCKTGVAVTDGPNIKVCKAPAS